MRMLAPWPYRIETSLDAIEAGEVYGQVPLLGGSHHHALLQPPESQGTVRPLPAKVNAPPYVAGSVVHTGRKSHRLGCAPCAL
jgi:hypothetical protein